MKLEITDLVMSEVAGTSYLSCIPTTSALLYLLGGFACEWQEIGRQLSIGEDKLREISNHVEESDHQKMEKMFDYWLLKEQECNWSSIQKALKAIGEKNIAENFPQHLPKQTQSTEFASTEKSYQDQWRKTFEYKKSKLNRLTLTDIVSILRDEKGLWFRLGTALGVSQPELDKIKTADEDDRVKLSKVIKIWTEQDSENSWQKLIDILSQMGYMDIRERAWAIVRTSIEEERKDDLTLELQFLQYRSSDPGSLFKLSENPEYKRIKRDIIEYFDLKNITDTSLLEQLKEYYVVEEFIVMKLNRVHHLCTELVRKVKEDIADAERIQTMLRVNLQVSPKKSWFHSFLRQGSNKKEFNSNRDKASMLLKRRTKRADINHSATGDSLRSLEEWRELASAKSELLQIYTVPTVSRLYYTLGELTSEWRDMGRRFKIPEAKLKQIAADNPRKSYRCMIEMLHYWVTNSDECTWETVEKILKDMDEKKLAEMVQHYIREMTRIQHRQRKQGGLCKKLVPLKDQCYEDWWLKQVRFEDDPLSLLHDPTMKTVDIARCLQERAAHWDELGIALEMSKGTLSRIDDDNESSTKKLQEMIQTWLEDDLDHSWRKLINALSQLDCGEAAMEVEKTARKLKQEAKEKDTLYASSLKVDSLSLNQETRELKRVDFKSRASESEKITKEKEQKLAATLSENSDNNIIEQLAVQVHKHNIEYADMMNIEQQRKEYTETLIQTSRKNRELAENYKETLHELVNDQRELLNVKRKLEEYRDKIQLKIEEVDIQINILHRSERTAQNKLALLERLSSDKKILNNKLGSVNRSLTKCMRLQTSIQRDHATISQELRHCADKLQACYDLQQETMKYTQEFKTGIPKQWEEYHKNMIPEASIGVGIVSLLAAAAGVALAPPLVPIIVGAVSTSAWTVGVVGIIKRLVYTPKIHEEDYHAIVETCDRNTLELESEMYLTTAIKEAIQRLANEHNII